ncbi:MAG: hypothetical protein JW727_05260 [Candidatus Aenigmarchaeota archaeon]|nr:hypothetical protein [Candidatus Aenigmarchaeota archaeon]
MAEKASFEELWNSARKSIFRLEKLPAYSIPEEKPSIESWRAGKPQEDSEDEKWLGLLDAAKQKGVKVQRVRLFSLPLSEYLRYEIAIWQLSSKRREEIHFLSQEEYQKISRIAGISPGDFWLFDDTLLWVIEYNGEGGFLGGTPVTETETARRCAALKSKCLEKSIPINAFLKTLPAHCLPGN